MWPELEWCTYLRTSEWKSAKGSSGSPSAVKKFPRNRREDSKSIINYY